MIGWLADFFRFAWGLLYWNLRKSTFRLRRGRSSCPCQNPSDSGRAWETGCDASLGWQRPERFRGVCPLLKPAPDGNLRCSVDAADVRPFWGRALAVYGGATIALYLSTTLAAFAFLRAVGYPVGYVAVVWPPAWARIDEARAVYFRQKAATAYTARNFNEAILSLSLAYELNPRDYSAGLLLAQLWQTAQPALSNRLYARLLHDHPDRWSGTAQAWFRALLARGDYTTLAQLSADAVHRDADHATAWIYALGFSTRHNGELEPLQAAFERSAYAPLPVVARTLLTLEHKVRVSTAAEAFAALRTVPAGEAHEVGLFRARRLAELGHPREALELLDRLGARLDDRDALAVRLDAYARLGASRPREQLVTALLRGPLTPAVADLLGAHLIRHPSPRLYAALFDKLDRAPPPDTPDSYSLFLTLFCVAGVYEDAVRLRATATDLKRVAGTEFATLARVESFFRRETSEARFENYLPVLQPLPLEITYALLDRFAQHRSID